METLNGGHSAYIPDSIAVLCGAGIYPRLVVEGARAAGVKRVDVAAVRGSADWATKRAADSFFKFGLGEFHSGMKFIAGRGYDGVVLAGQINPLALFATTFDSVTLGWIKSLRVKNAHSIFGKVVEEFGKLGVKVFPASSFMDGHLPGEGLLTSRPLTPEEECDISYASAVVRDIGRHDIGQTVMVKEGMVLAVEAFEGTNAAIKRGGKLGGRGAIVFKGAREGHDMRFDIPVAGLKTLDAMRKAGASALAFQAGRLVLLEREKFIERANKFGIAVVGVKTDLPPAPLRPLIGELAK
jgi:DUF1009 family protein